jgi:peptide/nickel transport system permease protein
MLILLFAVELGWLPSTGRGAVGSFLGIRSSFFTADGLAHVLLPSLNLALFNIALVIRLTRAGASEAILTEYVKFARAKGLSWPRVIFVHVLKNISIPLVTVLGLNFGSVIAFAVVTETIFAWPGVGRLVIQSINQLDRPVIVAYLLLTVAMFVAINLVVDILYSVLDPRIRLGEGRA